MPLIEALHSQFNIQNEAMLNSFAVKWSDVIEIKRNHRLITFGEKVNHVYYIESGTCCITYPDEKEDIVLGFGYPNTFLLSPSILHKKPSEQEVIVIKKSVFKCIPIELFFEFIYSSEEIKTTWLHQIEHLLLSQIDRQIDLLISSPEERLNRLLKRSPHVFQLIPQKYIASYLRMSPETLSRIQKTLI